MAATLQKIRLTFLWADESVMSMDFQKKVSEKMVNWANAFYKPYGLELDARPMLKRPTSLAYKFLLRKSDGIRPDPDFDEEAHKEKQAEEEAPFRKELEILENERNRLKEEQAAIDAENDRIDARIKALDAQYDAEPDRDAKHAIHVRIMALYAQMKPSYPKITVILNRISAIGDEKEKVREKIKQVEATYEQLKKDIKGEIPLRVALGLKFQDKIINERRLPVVFCDFVSHKLKMRNRNSGRTLAETFIFTPDITESIFFLWPKPFIMIDVNSPVDSTLAHEIVHAPGRIHPFSKKVIKSLKDYLNFRPATVEGSFINRAVTLYQNEMKYKALFREVPGGFYDGPDNSILNYNSLRFSPDEVILTDPDKDKLLNSDFVKEPADD